MSSRNPIAKNAPKFNRPSVIPNKKKLLQKTLCRRKGE